MTTLLSQVSVKNEQVNAVKWKYKQKLEVDKVRSLS
jgi:hypothetical protein